MEKKRLNLVSVEAGKQICFSTLSEKEMNQITGGENDCTCKKNCDNKKCCYSTTSNATGDKTTTTTTTIPINLPTNLPDSTGKDTTTTTPTNPIDPVGYVLGF